MTKQGSLSLLQSPIAQELLQSQIYARLGYIGADGAPRVIPINFHWNGKDVVLGSHPDGPKVAAILSIVETCRRLHIPVRKYLAAVLPGLANISIQRLHELTPAAWATRNQ